MNSGELTASFESLFLIQQYSFSCSTACFLTFCLQSGSFFACIHVRLIIIIFFFREPPRCNRQENSRKGAPLHSESFGGFSAPHVVETCLVDNFPRRSYGLSTYASSTLWPSHKARPSLVSYVCVIYKRTFSQKQKYASFHSFKNSHKQLSCLCQKNNAKKKNILSFT